MKSVSKKKVLTNFILLLLVLTTQQIQAQEVGIIMSRIGQYEEDSIVFKTELVIMQNGKMRYKVYKGQLLENTIEAILSSIQGEELNDVLSHTKLRHIKSQYKCSGSDDKEKYVYAFNTKRWQTNTLVIGRRCNSYLREVDALIDKFLSNQLAQN